MTLYQSGNVIDKQTKLLHKLLHKLGLNNAQTTKKDVNDYLQLKIQY